MAIIKLGDITLGNIAIGGSIIGDINTDPIYAAYDINSDKPLVTGTPSMMWLLSQTNNWVDGNVWSDLSIWTD
jgi:hypothetical protein